MMMNTKVKPLDDVRVRRAIQHLWNRAAWKASLGGVVGEQFAPAPIELLGEDYKPAVYEYDLAKAKALLAEAGYPNGGFKITHYYLEGDTHKKAMAELLQDELRQVGIQMDIRSVIVARMFEMIRRLRQDEESRQPDRHDHASSRPPASSTCTTISTGTSTRRRGSTAATSCTTTIRRSTRLLAQAAAALDDAEARPLYRKVADLVMRDAPTIMIERLVGKMYTRKNIEGFYFNLKMYPATVVFYDIRKK